MVEDWSLTARVILGVLISAATAAIFILTYGGGNVDVALWLVPPGAAFWLFRGFFGKLIGAAFLFAVALGFFEVFLQLDLRALVREY